MQLSSFLVETGWRSLTQTQNVGAFFRCNGFPRRLLITFDALSEFNHSKKKVSGDRVALHCQADHVHIGTTRATWFQSPDLFDVIREVRDLRDGYEEAILYGQSMGGYAALLLSGRLAATNVVAMSPQFSIDPAKAPFEMRFRSFADTTSFVFDDMAASISRTAPKYVVYDPHSELDRKHFKLLAPLENIRPIKIPFAGHYPGQMLREGGVLRQMITALLLQRSTAADRRAFLRAARRRSHRYYVERAVHVSRRGRFKDALTLINVAYVLAPDNPSVLETMQALLHADSRYYGLAHAVLKLLLKEHPNLSCYENTRAAVWRELEFNAGRVINSPMMWRGIGPVPGSEAIG